MKRQSKQEKPSRGRADLKRVRRMSDSEVRDSSAPELSGLPHGFWDTAMLVEPVRKQAISLRVDEDVLTWFKECGPRYQSRMNAVLRSYMHSRLRGRARSLSSVSRTRLPRQASGHPELRTAKTGVAMIRVDERWRTWVHLATRN